MTKNHRKIFFLQTFKIWFFMIKPSVLDLLEVFRGSKTIFWGLDFMIVANEFPQIFEFHRKIQNQQKFEKIDDFHRIFTKQMLSFKIFHELSSYSHLHAKYVIKWYRYITYILYIYVIVKKLIWTYREVNLKILDRKNRVCKIILVRFEIGTLKLSKTSLSNFTKSCRDGDSTLLVSLVYQQAYAILRTFTCWSVTVGGVELGLFFAGRESVRDTL